MAIAELPGENPLQEPIRLRVEIKNTEPIALEDLTTGLNSLATQFRRYADAQALSVDGAELKLYVSEIRSGSIIAFLVSNAPQFAIWAAHARAVIDFAKDLKSILDYFAGREAEKTERSAQELRTVSGILEPIAKDLGAQLNIAAEEGSTVTVHIHVNSTEANAIQNRIANRVALLQSPEPGVRLAQLFRFYQARDDLKSKTGDLGVIEAISPKPIKVWFANEDVKQRMIDGDLFNTLYLVDVEVHMAEGKPKLYKILAVRDSFPKDE